MSNPALILGQSKLLAEETLVHKDDTGSVLQIRINKMVDVLSSAEGSAEIFCAAAMFLLVFFQTELTN